MHFDHMAVDCEIPRKTIDRIIRKIGNDMRTELRFTRAAINAIRVKSEAFLVALFKKANLARVHVGRETLMRRDMQLVNRICKYNSMHFF